jgi:tetratricopeptide (TPR) repeat protein
VSASTVYISHDPGLDWLEALPFGSTTDGQPPERWDGLSRRFGFYLDLETGVTLGFSVTGLSEFDVDDDAHEPIWTGPRFTAPQLGLDAASAGEIILAARKYFGSLPSINRFWFNSAVERRGRDAIAIWEHCLESGDVMAHFALGYTHYELGDYHEAYDHLRYYTGLAPAQPWVWCWFGMAAEALGETIEARAAYERAIELTEEGGDETEAGKRLAALGG